MKKFGNAVSQVVVCGVVLLAASFVSSVHAQTQQGKATVSEIVGSGEYSEAGGSWMVLKPGKVLKSGAMTRTGAGAEIGLDLGKNGPLVRLYPNTTLGIDKLLFEHTGADLVIETQLDLKAGRISGKVAKTSSVSKYEVKTPNAVFGIKSGEYTISADSRATVKTGQVVAVYVDSAGKTTTFVVNAGQTFDPTIPGVRPATQPEIDSVKPGVGAPSTPVVVAYEAGREPYVSPISGKARSAGTVRPVGTTD